MPSIELHGLVFEEYKTGEWRVFDINYGHRLGRLVFEEGPGWIFTNLTTSFLDMGQMATIVEFVKSLDSF